MHDALQMVAQGGPVMIPLVLLSCLIYERCFRLLSFLVRLNRRYSVEHYATRFDVARLREFQAGLREHFSQEATIIGCLVAAAPLLGLLGTVFGMVDTFDAMGAARGPGASEGFAEGISMALITTETGLAIAIPAVIGLHYAQRQLQRVVQVLIRAEDVSAGGS